jgi:ribosomal protein S18 acetylase RimI-like enzyme
MATLESSGFGLRRTSSSCFGPPPLLIQLIAASRCDGSVEGGADALDRTVQLDTRGQEQESGGERKGMSLQDVGGEEERLATVVPGIGPGLSQGGGEASPAERQDRGPLIDGFIAKEQQQTTLATAGRDTGSSARRRASVSDPSQRPSPLSTHQLLSRHTPPSPFKPIYTIRKAKLADIPQFGPVERSAGEVFRTVGLDALADDEPIPQEVLRTYAEGGWVWVAVRADAGEEEDGSRGARKEKETDGKGEEVVGFLACFPIVHYQERHTRPTGKASRNEEVDEDQGMAHFHIAELSVHTAHQKRGLGRRLLAAMFDEIKACPDVLAPGLADAENEIGEVEGDAQGEAVKTQLERPMEDVSEETGETDTATSLKRRRGRRKVPVRGYSLTTYRHLSFNRRFYESVGFRELEAERIEEVVGKRGRELWDEEQAAILRKEMRCWMIRDL